MKMTEFLINNPAGVGACFICSDETPLVSNCRCKVVICRQCMEKWLGRKRQCPHCQSDLMPFEEWNTSWKRDEMRDDLEEDDQVEPQDLFFSIAVILSLNGDAPVDRQRLLFITKMLYEICYIVDHEDDLFGLTVT